MEARKIPYWNAVQTTTSDTWPRVIISSFLDDPLSGQTVRIAHSTLCEGDESMSSVDQSTCKGSVLL